MQIVFSILQTFLERLLLVYGNITLLNIWDGALPRIVVSHPCRKATHKLSKVVIKSILLPAITANKNTFKS